MLENRSFDHMLGFSGIVGTDAVSKKPTSINGLHGESNTYGNKSYPVTPSSAVAPMPADPGHELPNVALQLTGQVYPANGPFPTPLNMTGFVTDYVASGGQANPGQIMNCYTPSALPVLIALATEFAVCDLWCASMPGPTWPNRFFAMAASSGGLDRSPDLAQMGLWGGTYHGGFSFEKGSLFDALGTQNLNWIIYRGDQGPPSGSLPIAAALKGVSTAPWSSNVKRYGTFSNDLQAATYPYQFTWIEPNYGNVATDTYLGGTSQHPTDGITGGERLIKETYEAIRNSPVWTSSLLIVTWDEHGGFYDHVPPIGATPPGDTIVASTPPGHPINQFGFPFDLYGVRVPAVIVSPFVPHNIIDHRLYDHSSIPATMQALFGFAALTKRDLQAASVDKLLTLNTPRNTPATLPNPATSSARRAIAKPPAEELAQPIGHGNLAGFVHVALRTHLQMTPPEEHPAILSRVQAFTTRGEALAYIDDVATKLNDATGASPATTAPSGPGRVPP